MQPLKRWIKYIIMLYYLNINNIIIYSEEHEYKYEYKYVIFSCR
jgi:hypothetical protein